MKPVKRSFSSIGHIAFAGLVAVWGLGSVPQLHAKEVIKPDLPKADVPKKPLPSVLVLDPTEKVWSLQVSDGSRFIVQNGDVVVNSTHQSALWNTDSSIQVMKGTLNEVGGYHHAGRFSTTPPPQMIDQPIENPIGDFEDPQLPTISQEKLFLNDNSDITLRPGVYNGGIFASGENLHITLAPGVYLMNDGDFFMSGCTVQGKGVTIIMTGAKAGMFWTAAKAQVYLLAPTTGGFKNMVLISRAKGWNKVQLGTVKAKFVGTIYAPDGGVAVLQNSLVSATRIICYNLSDTVSSYLEVTGDIAADTATDNTPPAPAPENEGNNQEQK